MNHMTYSMYRNLQNTSINESHSSKKLATSSKLATGSRFPTLKKTELPASQPTQTNITTSSQLAVYRKWAVTFEAMGVINWSIKATKATQCVSWSIVNIVLWWVNEPEVRLSILLGHLGRLTAQWQNPVPKRLQSGSIGHPAWPALHAWNLHRLEEVVFTQQEKKVTAQSWRLEPEKGRRWYLTVSWWSPHSCRDCSSSEWGKELTLNGFLTVQPTIV